MGPIPSSKWVFSKLPVDFPGFVCLIASHSIFDRTQSKPLILNKVLLSAQSHSKLPTLLRLLLLKEWVVWLLSSGKCCLTSYHMAPIYTGNKLLIHTDLSSLMRDLGVLPEKEVWDNSLNNLVLQLFGYIPLCCLILMRQAFSWMFYFLLTWSNVVCDTEYSSICKFSLLEIINRKILAREEEQIWYCSML